MLFPGNLQKSLRVAPRSVLTFTLVFLLLVTFLYHASAPSLPTSHSTAPGRAADDADTVPASSTRTCGADVGYLSQLELSGKIRYGRLEIDVSQCRTPETCSTTSLNVSLPEFQDVQLDVRTEDRTDSLLNVECPAPVRLRLPPVPARPDASNLFFGVATKIDRLEESLFQFPHWMAHTGARMIAIIETSTAERVREIEERAKKLGLLLQIQQSDDEFNDRYYELTKAIYEKRDDATQWGVVIDDDTFFPSISNVLKFLSTFDASKGHYVGGLTEDFFQTRNFGYMGYGGAGVFLSVPLLKDMHEVYDECYANKATGDRRIADCVHWHTLVKFTPEPLLHQLDMGGDLSGFYESGRPQPLSFHHWKSWHNFNVTALIAVAPITGDDALLRRWRLDNGWFLTNGYSIVKYSEDLPEKDITMEQTWNGAGSYGHSMDPTRPKDEKKISYRLQAAERERSGSIVRQYYVNTKKWQDDEVLEVIWRRV